MQQNNENEILKEECPDEGEVPLKEPETKKKNIKPVVLFVIQLLSCLLMVEFICLPLLMLALDGPDETHMSNEVVVEVKPLTPSNFLSGEFQSTFESWFSKHYPLRSEVVRTYNQGIYNLNNTTVPGVEKETVQDWEIDTSIGSVETDEYGENVIVIPIGPKETIPSKPAESLENRETESGKVTPGESETSPEDYNYYLDSENNIYWYINSLQMFEKLIEPKGSKGTDRVAIGKSGVLFEYSYMQDYLGLSNTVYTTYKASALQETVNRLEYIQQQLNKRGIGFVFVLSSSKASQYADYIPDWYINANKARFVPDYIRAYDALLPMLEKSSLNYVDSTALFVEKGLAVTFPKTGIHWNKLAAFEATRQAVLQLEAQMKKPTRHMTFTNVKATTNPTGFGNSEQDIYNILYGELGDTTGAIRDTYYFRPEVLFEEGTENREDRNVLIQGGSFTHDIVYYCGHYVGKVRQIYYNWNNYSDGIGGTSAEDNPLGNNYENWGKLLNGVDYVLFEATEQQVATIAWGAGGHAQVYESLYRYLKAHEGD